MRKIIGFVFLLVIISSCGGRKKSTTVVHTPKKQTTIVKPQKDSILVIQEKVEEVKPPETIEIKPHATTQQYIEKYASIAMQKMRTHRIPASITLAQGILESGSGNSRLALQANNHFGIKCHKEWAGEKIYHDDDAKGECFRVYPHPEGSFEDHSLFLTTRPRYVKLFALAPDDYQGWAFGLSAAGYATDKKYPQKLIAFIHKYDLTQYDKQVMAELTEILPPITQTVQYHTVQKGEGLYAIAKQYDMKIEEIIALNQLKEEVLYEGQSLKILTSNTKIPAPITQETSKISITEHRVEGAETLYSIAKKYNTTVDNIRKVNQLVDDTLSVGQLLKMEYLKPVGPDTNVVLTRDIQTPDYHIVEKGENLFQIATRYGLDVAYLREVNSITHNDIKIGQKLLLKKDLKIPNIQPADSYTVQKGDTLYAIAKKTNVSVDTLIRLNQIQENQISVGQVLRLR